MSISFLYVASPLIHKRHNLIYNLNFINYIIANDINVLLTFDPESTQAKKIIPSNYYDPIYRSQRQYYFVGPNGTPMPAPPPPPFPQYSIDQAPQIPYSYSNSLGLPPNRSLIQPNIDPNSTLNNSKSVITLEEEMELYGIQNDCVRVAQDFVNGGFMCDDYD